MTVKHYERTKDRKMQQFNRDLPLVEYLIPLIGDKKEVSILDAGAGPLLTIGNQLEGVKLNITACDNLAEEYRAIYGDRMFDVEYQNIEDMTYPDNSFDIVHCVNALDHTKHPDKALAELKRVARDYIYLRHYENEGENQNYSGIHRWNISKDGTIWNKKRRLSLLDDFTITEKVEDYHGSKNEKQIVAIHALYQV